MDDQAAKLREIVKAKEEQEKKNSGFKNAKIIAVTSGKGGVGKTSLSVNMAAMLVKRGKKVLVIDADLGLSNVEIMLGMTPSFTIRDLIKRNKEIEEIIIKGPFGIDFISGGNGVFEITDLSDVERDEILVKMGKLDREYEYIIIDTGAGVSKNVISFLVIADEIVVITTTEPTAITDAYSIIKIIDGRKKDANIGIVINRVKEIKEHKEASSKLITISEKFLNRKLENLGFIYEDKVIRDAIFKKTPFVLYYPDSKAASCVEYILDKFTGKSENIKDGIVEKFKGFFKNQGR